MNETLDFKLYTLHKFITERKFWNINGFKLLLLRFILHAHNYIKSKLFIHINSLYTFYSY